MLPPAPVAGLRNSHSPLSDCQSGRVICGRGYSGSGSVVLTCEVHGVDRGGGLGATAALAVGATGIVQSSARTRTARRRIGLPQALPRARKPNITGNTGKRNNSETTRQPTLDWRYPPSTRVTAARG